MFFHEIDMEMTMAECEKKKKKSKRERERSVDGEEFEAFATFTARSWRGQRRRTLSFERIIGKSLIRYGIASVNQSRYTDRGTKGGLFSHLLRSVSPIKRLK